MNLKEQIQADLIAAMKSGDEVAKGAIRMLKAAILKFEVEGEKKLADDAAVINLVQKEIKQRKDSAEAYRSGNNEELAKKEEAEIQVLLKYLPAQLSETEVRSIIVETLSAAGITSKAEIGKAMGLLMPKLKGKTDGALINKIVGELLK